MLTYYRHVTTSRDNAVKDRRRGQTLRDLNFQLRQLCRRNLDGSYKTEADRLAILMLIANQLHDIGYRRMSTQSLKPKHVDALVDRWQAEDVSDGTIKNRMSVLRWWAEKINKKPVVARSNDLGGRSHHLAAKTSPYP